VGQESRRADALAWGAVALLTAVGLAGRLWLAGRSGLWRDEAQGVAVSLLPTVGDVLAFLREHESHPPLYYLLLRAWQGVFGRSDAALLAFPLLFGAFLPPALYIAGRRMFDSPTGLIAAVLGAFAPALAFFAAEVRPYSLLQLLALAAAYTAWLGLTGQAGRRVWAANAAATTALLYTHNWALFVVAGFWAGAVVAAAFVSGRWRSLGGFVAAQSVALALYLPWVPTLLGQATHAGHVANGMQPIIALPVLLVGWTVAAPNDALALAYVAGAVLISVAGAVLPVVLARRAEPAPADADANGLRAAVALLGVGSLVAYALAVVAAARTDTLWDRTVATLAPFLLLLLAFAVRRLAGRGASWSSWIAPAAVIAAILGGVYAPYLAASAREWKSDAREAARFVAAQARPDDLVLVLFEWEAADFNRYFTGSQEQIDFPEFGRMTAARFDDTRARLADPDAYRRLLTALDAARRAGHRTWLLLPDGYWPPAPGQDTPPYADLPASLDFGAVSAVRARQIVSALSNAYSGGQAREAGLRPPGVAVRHGYRLVLFEPPAAAPRPEETAPPPSNSRSGR
jgi:mannosyltransferase